MVIGTLYCDNYNQLREIIGNIRYVIKMENCIITRSGKLIIKQTFFSN